MANFVAVLALDDALIGAVGLAVARLLAIEANLLNTAWTVLGEVPNLVAVLALNTLSRAFLGTILVVVLKGATVLAAVPVDLAGSGAVTGQMASLLTVGAGDDNLSTALVLLILAGIAQMTYSLSVFLARRHGWQATLTNLVTVAALLNESIHDESSRCQALHILLLRRRPSLG